MNISNFYNNSFNSNIYDSINENYIRRIIKEELHGFIYQYQKDLSNRMNYLESKIDKINKKINNNNFDLNSNNISIEQGNKISEMEYKLSEIESFFKQWKEIIKDNDDNIYKSRVKINNEQELKLMQLDTKLSNQLKIIYDKINADINDIKKSMEKIKISGVEINKLEVEMKKINVDFSYLSQDVKDIKYLFNNEFKKEFENININNNFNNFIQEINILKEDFEKISKQNNENNEKMVEINKKFKILSKSIKESKINFVEEVEDDDNNDIY